MILYVMLTGAYPFEDPRDPRNMKKTVEVLNLLHTVFLPARMPPPCAPRHHDTGLEPQNHRPS